MLIILSAVVASTGNPANFSATTLAFGVIVLTLIGGVFGLGLRWKRWSTTRELALTLYMLTSMLCVYLATFAVIHWSISQHDPLAYSPRVLTRLDAFYFTVTTFTTTGFGDIQPTSSAARVAATFQMTSGFLILAVIIVLVLNRVAQTWRAPRPEN